MQGALPPAAPAVDVSNVKMSDVDDFLSRSMTIKANNESVMERILDQLCFQIVFPVLHPDTGAPLHEGVCECSA